MRHFERLIHEIQTAILAPDVTDLDLVRDMSVEYSDACAAMNERLSEVSDLLGRGLRTEALQLAEQPPRLLDAVATLDFPQRGRWESLVRQWEMVLPPPLALDSAAELNEAYSHEDLLQPLLRNHRLLALARAPVASRIYMLRRIRARDPDNQAWYEDLKTLEQARLKQIEREADRARNANDADRLASLKEELIDSDWLAPVPHDLTDQISSWHEAAAAQRARDELNEVEADLTSAYSAFDVESGRAARARWNRLAVIAALAENDPLTERAAPALEWLKEIDHVEASRQQHERDVAELADALDAGAPRVQLDRLYHRAAEHVDGVPAHLDSRYRNHVESLDLTKTRRYRLGALAVAAAILLISFIVWHTLTERRYGSRVASAVHTIEQLANGYDFDRARQFHGELHPSLKQAGPIIAAIAEVEAKEKAEIQRHRSFEDALAKAEANLKAAIAMGAATGAVHQMLARAEMHRSARTPPLPQETQRLGGLREQLRHFEKGRIDDAAQRLAHAVQAYQNEVTRIESSVETNPKQLQQAIAALDALRSKINESLDAAAANGVKEAELKTAILLHRYALNLRTEYSNRNEQDVLRQRVTRHVGNVGQFQEALGTLQGSDHFHQATSDLERVLSEEVRLWEEAQRWNDFVSQSAFYTISEVTPSKAEELLEAGKQLEDFPVLPIAEEFRSRRKQLQAIAGRLDEENKALHLELKRFLDAPGVRGLWFIEFENGQWCYTDAQPANEVGDQHVIDRVKDITADGVQTGLRTFTSRIKRRPRRAPHSEVAESAREALEQLNTGNWENTLCEILAKIQNHDEMDPILKLVMIQSVIRVGQRGSAVLEEQLTEAANIVNGHFIPPSIKWYDPDDADASRERKKATEVLQRLDNVARFSELKSIAAGRIREMFQRPKHRYEWIGWLGRDSSGGWSRFLRNAGYANSSTFCVLVPVAGGNGGKFVAVEISPVGEISPATAGRFGRPLYRQTKEPISDQQ